MSEIHVDEQHMLRLMGYREQTMDDRLRARMENAIAQVERAAKPRWVKRSLSLEHRQIGGEANERVRLMEANLSLPGLDIERHLAGATHCVLMAVTIGYEVDRLITRLQAIDLSDALIADAAASTLVEQACDRCQQSIQQEQGARGFRINARYSPGYGDLPLSVQQSLTTHLDTARLIGLYCNQSDVLLPRKSVTAIVGVFPM